MECGTALAKRYRQVVATGRQDRASLPRPQPEPTPSARNVGRGEGDFELREIIDGLNVVALAKVPSLVLSGPALRPNRFYSTNTPQEDVVPGLSGEEFLRRKPPYTVDLLFTLTATSERTAELLNLMAAVATFLNRNRWLDLPCDPADTTRGVVRWEMDPDGEFRTRLGGKDDVRAFTCGLLIRGFDIDEGLPLDFTRPVIEALLETSPLPGGAL